MIQFRCPKCDQSITAAPTAAGGQTVCSHCSALVPVPGDARTPTPSKYLLNPGATGRYHTHTLQYGVAFFPGGVGALRQPLQRFSPMIGDDANPFAGMKDNQVDQLRHDLSWVAHELKLSPPAAWQD